MGYFHKRFSMQLLWFAKCGKFPAHRVRAGVLAASLPVKFGIAWHSI